MAQRILPLLPSGSNLITDTLSVVNAEGCWTYFQGVFPVFTHAANDQRAERAPGGRRQNSFLCDFAMARATPEPVEQGATSLREAHA